MTQLQCICVEWAETGFSQEEIKLSSADQAPLSSRASWCLPEPGSAQRLGQGTDPAERLGMGLGGTGTQHLHVLLVFLTTGHSTLLCFVP